MVSAYFLIDTIISSHHLALRDNTTYKTISFIAKYFLIKRSAQIQTAPSTRDVKVTELLGGKNHRICWGLCLAHTVIYNLT